MSDPIEILVTVPDDLFAILPEDDDGVKSLKDNGKSEGDDDFDPDEIEVLSASDAPPSAVDEFEEDFFEERKSSNAALRKAQAKVAMQDKLTEAIIAGKKEVEEALERTQVEAKRLREQNLRVNANFENFKKRANREKEDAIRFANDKILKELLPVIDNLERVLAADRDTGNLEISPLAVSLIEGVEMTHKQMEAALGKFGIKGFSAMGEIFDPNFHEAVQQVENEDVDDGEVLQEYHRGYFLHDRLIRPSMVVVAKGGPQRAKEEEEGEEEEAKSPEENHAETAGKGLDASDQNEEKASAEEDLEDESQQEDPESADASKEASSELEEESADSDDDAKKVASEEEDDGGSKEDSEQGDKKETQSSANP